jgi:hypothetical protein
LQALRPLGGSSADWAHRPREPGGRSRSHGPVIVTRELLEPDGRWDAAHEDVVALYAGYAAEDGSLDFPAEYLVIVGRKN